MNQGATFEQAILETASDGFASGSATLPNVLRTANCLLADGLDETDPNRAIIAGHLRDWALADKERRVVLTTRPVGHDPAWFTDWEHFELLPLDWFDVNDFAQNVFTQLHTKTPPQTGSTVKCFSELLSQSQTANLASRNPLLLGFLLALYINGYNIGGNRYRLFADILNLIGSQSRADREYQHQMNEAEARCAVDCLGWLLMHHPAIAEMELVRELGQLLASSFSLNHRQGEKIAQDALEA